MWNILYALFSSGTICWILSEHFFSRIIQENLSIYKIIVIEIEAVGKNLY